MIHIPLIIHFGRIRLMSVRQVPVLSCGSADTYAVYVLALCIYLITGSYFVLFLHFLTDEDIIITYYYVFSTYLHVSSLLGTLPLYVI